MSRSDGKLRVAIVGLRFGGSFPPIYVMHPDVAEVTICDTDERTLNAFGDKYGIQRRTTRLDDILRSPEIDAVHLVTPIPSHGSLSAAVLQAGKHCACTVPMATTLEELHAIVTLQERTGLNYMMMETTAYTYHCLFAEEMIRKGELGRIQFLRGAHLPGHGELACVLDGVASDALLDPRRCAAAEAGRHAGNARALLRFGCHAAGTA